MFPWLEIDIVGVYCATQLFAKLQPPGQEGSLYITVFTVTARRKKIHFSSCEMPMNCNHACLLCHQAVVRHHQIKLTVNRGLH